MNQIYEQKLWGGTDSDFYSGIGSHKPEIISPYLEALVAFLVSQNNALVVCDLGCGDFNIGKYLTKHTKKYIAVDIVENLIIRNKKQFQADNLEFHNLDISKDTLPAGDCIIIRQVLQHLCNAEIKKVVNKIANYKYVILTEHIPSGEFIPNIDIISGQGIRIKQHSGVNLLAPPFNLKIENKKVIDCYILENNKGRLVTTIYKIF
ncbi:class I SAM-dependent methyltransferase [Algibacter sp.]|uniref:class I SAM-dependent methyltransferase n=1 Tax=Algibacter sp. TaxID=1872428 RepID=UPI003C75D31E